MPDKAYARPTSRAGQLRVGATEAERRLWACLSARKIAGARFNRQVPIGSFICDFVARTPRLIVEVDGGQHAVEEERDQARTRYLEERGYRVLRFWNNEVLGNIEGVVHSIAAALQNRPSPSPSREREGSLPNPGSARA